MGIHVEPGAVQREGARAHHDLRQRGGGKRLRDSHRQRRQAVLQTGLDVLRGVGRRSDDAGVGVRLGGGLPAVLGGARRHVVAPESCPGVAVQVR